MRAPWPLFDQLNNVSYSLLFADKGGVDSHLDLPIVATGRQHAVVLGIPNHSVGSVSVSIQLLNNTTRILVPNEYTPIYKFVSPSWEGVLKNTRLTFTTAHHKALVSASQRAADQAFAS